MRVVLDSNVVIAAFAAHGLCESLFLVCLREHEIILSEHILAEISEHLADKIGLPPGHIREIEALLRDHARIVTPTALTGVACSDPDDLPVLGTAASAKADALVTGDKELLALSRVHDVAILSPRALLERMR